MRHFRVMVVAGLALLAAAAGAQAGPWCAWFNAYTYNCGFSSFQQCLDTIQGEGGYCARNVQEAGSVPAPRPVRHHRKPFRGD
jgi:hypothetical protein